jgi:hypothetical protein
MLVSNIAKMQSESDESIVISEESESVITHSEEIRYHMIAEAAYYHALARGFEEGKEDDDWYAAEAEIERAYGR